MNYKTRWFEATWLLLAFSFLAACGGGGDDGTQSTTQSQPQAPSNLHYSSPTTQVVGQPTNLAASVTGSVSSYSVAPSLPAGLNLNTSTGTISGTPAAVDAKATYVITAMNAVGSTTFSLVLLVNPAAPSALSYSTPSTATVGTAFTLTPTVTGTVASYSVSPALPTGLSLNTSTGVISGLPTAVASQAIYSINASNVTGSTSFPISLTVNPSAPTNLSYSTPNPFIVGVSLSLTPTVTGPVTQYSISPKSPALPVGLTINVSSGVISGTPTTTSGSQAYTVTAANVSGSTSATFNLEVDAGPTVVLTAQTTGTLSYYWKTTDGVLLDPTNGAPVTVNSPQTSTVNWMLPQGMGLHFAYLLVMDGQNNCYEARLVADSDALGASQSASSPVGSARLNYGGLITCTALTDPFFGIIAKNASATPPSTNVINSISATYNGSGTYNGNPFSYFQQIYPSYLTFQPQPSAGAVNEPSNAYQQSGSFFAYAVNNASDACQYYATTGAFGSSVASSAQNISNACDVNGNPTNSAIVTNFSAWINGLSNLAGQESNTNFLSGITLRPDLSTVSSNQGPAYFVNVMDLNLTREHHSVAFTQSVATTQGPIGIVALAAYVCNHAGPQDASHNAVTVNPSFFPSNYPQSVPTNALAQQNGIHNSLLNATSGLSLVACVAMDFAMIDGQQYTRFYVFGPSGELLPSVNLDGRGEKYVPGACTTCHGGSPYSAAAGTVGTADLKAYFLPYDLYNMAFDTQVAPYSADQFFALNENILYAFNSVDTAVSPGTNILVSSWYPAPSTPLSQSPPYFDYIPPSWLGSGSTSSTAVAYSTFVARGCRTCHTAISPDWDSSTPSDLALQAQTNVCPNTSLHMPNSLFTFNRFWDSHLVPNSLGVDQYEQFLSLFGNNPPQCNPPPSENSTQRIQSVGNDARIGQTR
jgi:Putative Ig domain